MKRFNGVTLIEVLVAAGLFSMILTAILSFYIEAAAVSAKRDEQSERLRRFHLGLDKIEQELREGRVVQCGSRLITFLALGNPAEINGFPNLQRDPCQFIVTKGGVVRLQGEEQKLILPLRADETVYFGWVLHNPVSDAAPTGPEPINRRILMRASLILYGNGKRSDILFSRTLTLLRY